MLTCITQSPEETAHLAGTIGKIIREGTVICLDGELGVGKTLFVRALARTLGVESDVTSPTFNLMNVYEGKMRLTHFDVYRLERAEELYDIGFYEYADDSEGVVVVEWFDKFSEEMPADYVRVTIERVASLAGKANSEEAADRRRLCFSLVGVQLKEFFEEMRDVVDSGD